MNMGSMDMTTNIAETIDVKVTVEGNFFTRTLPGRTVCLFVHDALLFWNASLTLKVRFTIAGELIRPFHSIRVFPWVFSFGPALFVEASQISTARPNFYRAPRSRTLSRDLEERGDIYDGVYWNRNVH
jgi:hypothetical protein